MYKKKQRFYPAEAPAANANVCVNCETGDNAILSRRTINRYRPLPIVTAFIASLALYGCGEGDGSTGIGGIGDGRERIAAAGRFTLAPEYNESTSDPVTEYDIPMGDYTATCTTEGWGESEVRDLVDTAGLDLSGTSLYPGALIRGSDFQNGTFVPITIPRSKGTIYLSGLNLQPGARYAAGDIEMTGSSVNQAIQDLINDNPVDGTAADVSYSESQTYSYEHMLFKLGIDARYGSRSMEADLAIDTETARSNAFVSFRQVYYSVTYDDPETSVSVFRDGAGFQDPEGQISENSPPMYVSKVNYGRMVFFVAESTHDSTEVALALNGAVSGGSGSVELDSGLTHKEVLDNSNVSYYAIGGNAGLTLEPIGEENNSSMFDAVKNSISDRENGNYSASSPGVPISYTLNYLDDRTPARMSYTVTGDRQDCTYTKIPAETEPSADYTDTKYYIDSFGLDRIEKHYIEINGEICGNDRDTTSAVFTLHNCLSDSKVNTVKVIFNKNGCNGVKCFDSVKSTADWRLRTVDRKNTTRNTLNAASWTESTGWGEEFSWIFTVDTRKNPSGDCCTWTKSPDPSKSY